MSQPKKYNLWLPIYICKYHQQKGGTLRRKEQKSVSREEDENANNREVKNAFFFTDATTVQSIVESAWKKFTEESWV